MNTTTLTYSINFFRSECLKENSGEKNIQKYADYANKIAQKSSLNKTK